MKLLKLSLVNIRASLASISEYNYIELVHFMNRIFVIIDLQKNLLYESNKTVSGSKSSVSRKHDAIFCRRFTVRFFPFTWRKYICSPKRSDKNHCFLPTMFCLSMIIVQVGPSGKEDSYLRLRVQHFHPLCLRRLAALRTVYGAHPGGRSEINLCSFFFSLSHLSTGSFLYSASLL